MPTTENHNDDLQKDISQMPAIDVYVLLKQVKLK